MKIAVCSCLGLGDALLSLILSHNLFLQGHEVTTFHPFLRQAQSWFPHLPIRPYPAYPTSLQEFEKFFIFYEKSDWMAAILDDCLTNRRAQTTVLNPIATPNTDYPFWEEGKFDGNKPFAENLYLFCRDVLQLPNATRSNGITIPEGILPRKYKKKVVIHPTSSKASKNWPKKKFLDLAERLRQEGFDPFFVVSPKERNDWPEAVCFQSLHELFTLVCESGYMIGNDSGVGHLASCLGLPTLTLCRNLKMSHFWRPGWAKGVVCTPSPWLPNLKGLRWRDRYWHRGMTVGKVLRAFERLVS